MRLSEAKRLRFARALPTPDAGHRMTPNAALAIAADEARRSTCRSQRGAVAWDHDGLISVGWNLLTIGACDQSDRCKAQCSRTAIHAEQLCILAANRSLAGASMLHVKIVADAPVPSRGPTCWQCSKLILAAGLSWMYLLQETGLRAYTAETFHQLTLDANALG